MSAIRDSGKLGPVDLGFDGIYENCQLALAVQEKKRVKRCEECFAAALCKKAVRMSWVTCPETNKCVKCGEFSTKPALT